ncbi:unnamed protein product [marine sediment metagenome]|uniref:Uncharacterized protein n=1 Tax=marine sediment metagenome TaxID=412755 RepID=X0UQQ9_9ZZZZ
MKVAFEAMIKEIKNKSLVSGDKATRVILEFDSDKKLDVLNSLNELHQADQNVFVVLMDEIEK